MSARHEPKTESQYFAPPRPPLARVNTKRRCPECDHSTGCMVADDRTICLRRPSDKPVRGGIGGWWHFYRFDDSPPKPAPQKPSSKPVERAGADHLDAILSALLRKHLALSERHKESLLARGLSEAEIERNGYRSTPDERRAAEVVGALSIYGLEGVPGFYRKNGSWRMVRAGLGFFVPYRDERGRVQGLQYRLDEPLDGGKVRYLWFSSRACSSGAPVHYAHRHLLRDAREVTITEGALKADVCAYFLRAPVIAAAGVSCFGADFAAKLKNKCPQLETAYLAFDADFQHKDGVKESLFRLADELKVAGIRARVRAWPARLGKGIDDYLLTVSKSEGRAVA